MIQQLTVENFKCFKSSTPFNLSSINLFAGYNGRGKSTVLQVLLLLAQSYHKNKHIKRLETNGLLCHQGPFSDLISFDSSSDKIIFEIHGDLEGAQHVKLEYSEQTERVGALTGIWVDGVNKVEGRSAIGKATESTDKYLTSYPPEVHGYVNSIYFVSADRRGPVPFETKSELYDFNPISADGKYSFNMLAQDQQLRSQLSEVLRYIMDGGDLVLSGNEDKTLDILSLYITHIATGRKVRSINSGFGYSYVLPILINALSLSNSILLIENPEAHLHPQAQSRLMQCLVRIAHKNNIQLFVETHSEHIVNAVRLCILEEDFEITKNDVSIYFFDKDMSVQQLAFDDNAQIKNWPSGFFDQQQNDTAKILKLGLFR